MYPPSSSNPQRKLRNLHRIHHCKEANLGDDNHETIHSHPAGPNGPVHPVRVHVPAISAAPIFRPERALVAHAKPLHLRTILHNRAKRAHRQGTADGRAVDIAGPLCRLMAGGIKVLALDWKRGYRDLLTVQPSAEAAVSVPPVRSGRLVPVPVRRAPLRCRILSSEDGRAASARGLGPMTNISTEESV